LNQLDSTVMPTFSYTDSCVAANNKQEKQWYWNYDKWLWRHWRYTIVSAAV